jgi:hypothetical protein
MQPTWPEGLVGAACALEDITRMTAPRYHRVYFHLLDRHGVLRTRLEEAFLGIRWVSKKAYDH